MTTSFTTTTSNIHTIFAPPNYRSGKVRVEIIDETFYIILDHSHKRNKTRTIYFTFNFSHKIFNKVETFLESLLAYKNCVSLQLTESGNPPHQCSDALYYIFEEDLGKLMKDINLREP